MGNDISGDGFIVWTEGRMVWPPKPQWELHIAPQFMMTQVDAPNAFHRVMQRLFLGFQWKRIPRPSTHNGDGE